MNQPELKKKLFPSLLSADFSCLAREIRDMEEAGADGFHIDVMDGHFVPNLTFGPPVIQKIRSVTSRPFDVHLMVNQPEMFIQPFATAGANSLTFHIESVLDPLPLLKQIRERGMKAGLTFRPDTSYEKVVPYLEQIDLLLFMTVSPGRGGQTFLKSQVEPFHQVKKEISRLNNPPLLLVDGGINPETAKLVSSANVFISGNYLFSHPDYTQALSRLRKAVS